MLSTAFVPQGPGPIINGQDLGITSPEGPNPVSGAISQVVVGSTPDNLFVATVNGGIWKTTNATAATPHWVPLTDNASLAQAGQFPSLSTQSIALSPLNASTIFAGAGDVSAFGGSGGARFGIARSTDGGSTWTVAGPTGVDIPSVVATRATVGGNEVILAGTTGGIYRSTDGGSSYSLVTAGVPAGNVTNLVGDPGISTRFFAAVDSQIYTSNDTGATWTVEADAGYGAAAGDRVLLSVHHDATNDVLYAMDIDGTTKNLSGVYRSADQGATFTSLGVPTPPLLQGQGNIHGAIVADPTDPNAFYLAGQFDDSTGSSNLFRYTSGAYQMAFGSGANGTGPHADARSLTTDQAGNLVFSGDGGIFKLTDPTATGTDPGRIWTSLNGDITPTESHSAVYDPVSNIFISGNQDNGDSYQTATGSHTWTEFATQGDGESVQVDADQAAHPGTSIRYFGAGLDSTYRLTFDASNKNVGFAQAQFNITSGPGTGQTINQFDPNAGSFVYTLNRITPARVLIGTQNLYESLNMGDSVANLGGNGNFIGFGGFSNTPISYGGLNADGSSNPGSFYAGEGSTLKHRSADGSPVVTLAAYPGSGIRAVVSDPKNVAHVFVLDDQNQVWASFNEGATFTNLTANLGSLSPQLNTLEIFSPTNSPLNTVLLVGGTDGVFQLRRPTAAGTSWTSISAGLPKGVLVYDLRYEYTQNVLTIGTLGRGVWSLTNFFRGGGGTGIGANVIGVPINGPITGGPITGGATTGSGTVVTTHPVRLPVATPAPITTPVRTPPKSVPKQGITGQVNGATSQGSSRVETPLLGGSVAGSVPLGGVSNVVIPLPTINTTPVVGGPDDLFAPKRSRKLVAQSPVLTTTLD